jgi:phosphoesterase RecJ-like protein
VNIDQATVDGLVAVVRTARERGVVVLTHAKPDGDAVGSCAAAARTFERLGARAQVVFVGPVPRWTSEMMGPTPWIETPPGQPLAGGPGLDDAAVAIVDTGSWSQLGEVKSWLQMPGRRERTLMVDHHKHNDPDVGSVRVVDTDAASATQVLMRVLMLMLGAQSWQDIPREIAEPLYLGLATDTGWFRHSNTTAEVLATASILVQAGAEPAKLYELIEQREDAARLRLLSRALGSLRMEKGGRVAMMTLTKADYEAAGARRTDSGGFIDHPMTLAGVEVAALLTEEPPEAGTPIVKVSLRSKAFSPRAGFVPVDVNAVCRTFGGGGHARAAGAKIQGTVATVLPRLLAAIPD